MALDWRTKVIHQKEETERLADGRSLMDTHGLQAWKIKPIYRKLGRRRGTCHYGPKKITINYFHLVASDKELAMNTVLHEIAHALVGYEAGHGPVWRKKAREIGVTEDSLEQYANCRGNQK